MLGSLVLLSSFSVMSLAIIFFIDIVEKIKNRNTNKGVRAIIDKFFFACVREIQKVYPDIYVSGQDLYSVERSTNDSWIINFQIHKEQAPRFLVKMKCEERHDTIKVAILDN